MNRKLFTKLFWLDVSERSIAAFFESVISNVGSMAIGAIAASWRGLLMAALFSAALALAKGILAAAKADTDTASLVVDTKPLTK